MGWKMMMLSLRHRDVMTRQIVGGDRERERERNQLFGLFILQCF